MPASALSFSVGDETLFCSGPMTDQVRRAIHGDGGSGAEATSPPVIDRGRVERKTPRDWQQGLSRDHGLLPILHPPQINTWTFTNSSVSVVSGSGAPATTGFICPDGTYCWPGGGC